MEKRKLSWVLMVIGLVVALLSAVADPLGLGEAPAPAWRRAQAQVTSLLGERTTAALGRAVDRLRKAESQK